jgi:hypothetical protein
VRLRVPIADRSAALPALVPPFFFGYRSTLSCSPRMIEERDKVRVVQKQHVPIKKSNMQRKEYVWFKEQQLILLFEAGSAGGGSGCALLLRDVT